MYYLFNKRERDSETKRCVAFPAHLEIEIDSTNNLILGPVTVWSHLASGSLPGHALTSDTIFSYPLLSTNKPCGLWADSLGWGLLGGIPSHATQPPAPPFFPFCPCSLYFLPIYCQEQTRLYSGSVHLWQSRSHLGALQVFLPESAECQEFLQQQMCAF